MPSTKQRTLIKELDTICSRLCLDYWNSNSSPEWKTATQLELTLRWIVRTAVIDNYAFVDEILSCCICRYMFGKRSFPKLWRTEKFRLFNYYVIEPLNLLPKLAFVNDISRLPKEILADIRKLNDLRNGLAHSFFPENLKGQRAMWDHKDIFTSDGLAGFLEDMAKISEHFKDVTAHYRWKADKGSTNV